MNESSTAISSNPFFAPFLSIPETDYLGEQAFTFRNKLDFFVDNNLHHFEKGDHIGCFNDELKDGMRHWYTAHAGAIAHETKMNDATNELMTLITLLENGLTRWIPTKHCQPHGNRFVWKAGPYLYNIYLANNVQDDDEESEYHLAFKHLAGDNFTRSESPSALFTYWQGKRIVGNLHDCVKTLPHFDDQTHCKVQWTTVDPKLLGWMQQNHPEVPIYHALSRPLTAKVDDKFNLFRLYRKDAIAASAFPPTYGNVRDALADSEGNVDQIFFLKDRGSTQGLGIRILSRQELAKEPEQRGYSDYVIQKAIRDLLTLDDPKDGILYKRRFDIRFFVLVTKGKVYLHSNMYAMFSSPDKPYDPNDLSLENHVPKVGHYRGDNTDFKNRDFLFFPNTFQIESNGRLQDPVAWRLEIAKALSKATRAALTPILDATRNDSFAYHYFGADAVIEHSTGRAFLLEFNDWPDFSGFNARRDRCLNDNICPRRAVTVHDDGSYSISPPTKDHYRIFPGYSAQVLQDFVSLVIGAKHEAEDRVLEIKPWSEVEDVVENTCENAVGVTET